MGICRFCGKPAGFLKREHKECREKHNRGIFIIRSMVESSLKGNIEKDKILETAENSYINDTELKDVIFSGWVEALENALEDRLISEDEENILSNILFQFGFSSEELSSNTSYIKFIKAIVLRDVLEGKIPNRVRIDTTLPFNFLKDEKIIWIFMNTRYYQFKTHKYYTGGSQGFSIRITKGVYYRVGGFRGHPVSKTELTLIDEGILCITNKNIYFGGKEKSFRINYNKIVSFTPYSDGIGIQRDSANAKPEVFITDDGWFTYNLLVNLANKV